MVEKNFFTVLYRSPSSVAGSQTFDNFLSNFESLSTNIRKENPYAIFFTGDFNCHSLHWWPTADTNAEGAKLMN